MAGAGLINIKRRIKSVLNTKKITKAMGLVATSKLRKAREKLIINEQYHNNFNRLFQEVINNYNGNSVYLNGNESNKKLYIVITSDTGLCGSFNGLVVSKAMDIIREDKENSLVISIGEKGKSYFNRLTVETIAEYVEIPDIPTVKEAEIVVRDLLNGFNNGDFGEVYVVYTRFYSPVKTSVLVDKLLPVVSEENFSTDNVIIEPDMDSVFANTVVAYLKDHIYFGLLNSKVSEHSARMNAMEGATKNADDLLEKLNLKFNRVRQSSITQEISEIVGGAEAQR